MTLDAQGPSGLAGAVASELRLLDAGVRSATFRPLRSPSDVHSATETSSYRGLVIGLLLATAAELTAIHLGLVYYLGEGYEHVHVMVLLVHLYGVAWLMGDWRIMRESGHRIVDDGLQIELGLRWRGVIPLDSIKQVSVGEVPALDVLSGEKRPPHVLAVSPMDAPNITLHLDRPVELRTYFGLRRSGTEIQLFVDDPGALEDELSIETAPT